MDSKLIGKYLIVIAVIITFIGSSDAYATVSGLDPAYLQIDPNSYPVYRITGEITSKDVNQVKYILQSSDGPAKNLFLFSLDSVGGDIYAAMEIGRLIRKARAKCVVPKGGKCYSACVLILSGAVKRYVIGEVGIHRPYSTYVGNRDYESTQKEFRRTETAVKAYLTEMNLPGQLFEAMLRVPPEKVRILSPEQLEAFGLSVDDPVEEETEAATDAFRYGISKTEYLRRKASVDQVCPFPRFDSDFSSKLQECVDCREAYMYGVSISTYKARLARAKDACSRYKGHPNEFGSCWDGVLQGNR